MQIVFKDLNIWLNKKKKKKKRFDYNLSMRKKKPSVSATNVLRFWVCPLPASFPDPEIPEPKSEKCTQVFRWKIT